MNPIHTSGTTLTAGTPAYVARRIHATGGMADLIRAYDWASTPLGPIENWPETLLSNVNLILATHFPSCILWGNDLTQIYNDAFRPLIAEKHPLALGQRGRECWRDAWPIVGKQLEAAITRGETTLQKNVLVPILRGGQLTKVYWTYSYSPIFLPTGEIGGVLILCHDVTGEVIATRERDAFSGQLNQVLDATTDAVVFLDRDWNLAYLNPQAREILIPAGDVRGLNMWETFPYLDYPGSPYVRHYRAAMEEGLAGEFQAYYPEPLKIWFDVRVSPTPGGIAVFFRDITAQRETETAARETAARLDAIYNTSLEYIGLLSTDGVLLDVNRASFEFANNTREDVIGMAFWETPWFIHTPGAPELLRESIIRAADGEHVRYEAPLIRPNGEVIVFDFSLSPVRNARGEVVFIVPEGRDITWMKQAETVLKETEKLAAVGRLAASIAHEINNPLESVTNLLYLAMHTEDSEAVQGYLRTAEQELRRVSSISSQTLRFYRQSTKPRSITADELIESALSIHQGRIANTHVQLQMRLRPTRAVRCFEGEIRQVLNNLIGNAIDSMAATGGRLLLRTREATHWQTGRKGIAISVADTGSGISGEDLRRIFEPFFTTKGLAGTGLGLWVSKEIVDRHKGSLTVTSSTTPGHSGTVFTLFLPFDGLLPASQPQNTHKNA